jgi:uncharacterized phage-associated protein
MAAVFDVAEYILSRLGEMSAMKLQKLVYYSQAWALAWTDRPLFDEEIEAWARGPVVPALYDKHKGTFLLKPGFFGGHPDNLSKNDKEVVDRVLAFYGNKDPQWLSSLTHLEDPWKKAREGMAEDERGNRIISKLDMHDYYSNL